MGKTQTRRKAPPKELTVDRGLAPLFVGEWIIATGKEQHEVVKATGISQGYIANMSGGRKANPSANYLRRIALFLEISMDDFYRRPLPQEQIEALRSLSPAARTALARSGKDRRQ